MKAKQTGFWRRHRALQWTLGALLLCLVAAGVTVSILLRNAEPLLRAAIVRQLAEHFHARVELDSFHISLGDGLWAEGKGLRIWPPAETAGAMPLGASLPAAPAPLIRLAEFRFHAPLRLSFGEPIHISVVELQGLAVDVPPKSRLMLTAPAQPAAPHAKPLLTFAVRSIVCNDAHLTLENGKPGKLPLEFAIARIQLTVPIAGGPMQFDATLTNPKPAGAILATGTIGPWFINDPGQTPLTGSYRFEHADLAVFKGIAGILTSTGQFNGVLRDMTVDGQTDTPGFRLTKFGTAVPLHTVFHAHVDATNGDTWLQPVQATLGESHFTAEGKIVRVPPGTAANGPATPGGHLIALNVAVNNGRMEDFLRLTSKSGTPLLTGVLHLEATLRLPPGTAPVDERLHLKGSFTLDNAQFTSEKIQDEVSQMSLRGQGRAQEAKHGADADVISAMQSDFTMTDAVVSLPNLRYTVPGAEIDLAGTYTAQGGLLDFTGTVKTQATVSAMVGGWKGQMLKPLDRLFSRNGAGTELPIHVSGTRENPNFGVDLSRLRHTPPAIPGQPQ